MKRFLNTTLHNTLIKLTCFALLISGCITISEPEEEEVPLLPLPLTTPTVPTTTELVPTVVILEPTSITEDQSAVFIEPETSAEGGESEESAELAESGESEESAELAESAESAELAQPSEPIVMEEPTQERREEPAEEEGQLEESEEPEELEEEPEEPEQEPEQAIPPTSTPIPIYTPTPRALAHIVEQGNTLSFIAQEYNIPLQSILELNNLAENSVLKIGQEIIIPNLAELQSEQPTQIPPSPTIYLTNTPVPPPTTADGHLLHFVQVGETLSQIAAQYDVLRNDILLVNGFRPDVQLTAGDSIIIPQGPYIPILTPTPNLATAEPTPEAIAVVVTPSATPTSPPATITPSPEPTEVKKSTHVVSVGDVAGRIALNYSVSIEDLAKANPDVNLESLPIGTELKIPEATVEEAPTAIPTATPTALTLQPTATPTSESVVMATHVVEEDETLDEIAAEHDISQDELAAHNNDVMEDGELETNAVLLVPVGTFTPTPEPTAAPTLTPTPAPPYMAPILLLPENNATWVHWEGKQPLQLVWTSSGLLKENEFYVATLEAIGRGGFPLWSESIWTQQTTWRLSEELLTSIEGKVTLRWYIQVMERTSAADMEPATGIPLSNKSDLFEMTFTYSSPTE